MQISSDAIKKTAKFLSFNNFSASSPSISPIEADFPFLGGGVLGRKKLNRPSTSDVTLANKNVLDRSFSFQASHPTNSPATIHPIVPNTLINENCFSGLLICLKETAFTNARVGIYNII